MLPSRIFLDDFFDEMDKNTRYEKMMKCDVYQQDDNYVIEMDLPGASKKDITLDIEKGYLTITYTKESSNENTDDKKYIRRERHSFTNCSRQFYVGEIDEEMINASFKDGILTVTMPIKEKEVTKRTINID